MTHLVLIYMMSIKISINWIHQIMSYIYNIICLKPRIIHNNGTKMCWWESKILRRTTNTATDRGPSDLSMFRTTRYHLALANSFLSSWIYFWYSKVKLILAGGSTSKSRTNIPSASEDSWSLVVTSALFPKGAKISENEPIIY